LDNLLEKYPSKGARLNALPLKKNHRKISR
jgi:hypothetical protein